MGYKYIQYIQYTPKLACPFLERGVAAGGLVGAQGPSPQMPMLMTENAADYNF